MKYTTIKELGDSIKLFNESMSFNNQQLSPSNIYASGDLELLNILLGKENSSPHWNIKFKSPSKQWKLYNHYMGDKLTIETLKVMSQSGKKKCW